MTGPRPDPVTNADVANCTLGAECAAMMVVSDGSPHASGTCYADNCGRPARVITREAFLREYEKLLANTPEYTWAREPGRLDRYMERVRAGISGETRTGWNGNVAEMSRRAWANLGGERESHRSPGPSLKQLRTLPSEVTS